MKKYEFGNRLCRLRENNKMTQRQLAYHLGVTDKAVSKWENAETQPKADMLTRIANFFGVTVDELLNGMQDRKEEEKTRIICLSPLFERGVMARQAGRECYPDILTETGKDTYDYMCTWQNQVKAAARLGITGEHGMPARNMLNARTLFGEQDYFHPQNRETRKKLILLLDEGWDVPYGKTDTVWQIYKGNFGAAEPDEERFFNYGKTPVERLKNICRKAEALGYCGVGLWISPQQKGEETYNSHEARKYWKERAVWSRDAGIRYWKVDWGYHESDLEYRKMMSEVVHRIAPDLVIEHTIIQLPLASLMTTMRNTGIDFPLKRRKMAGQLMRFSDVYRIYNLVEPFQVSSTLARVHEALLTKGSREYGALGLINVESQAYIAAALGCSVGVREYTNEIEVCLRWHKTAPPFGIYEGKYICSSGKLTDKHFYNANVGELECAGMYFEETAPAVMARNCALPIVTPVGEQCPFVAASKNPYTNVYSVGIYRRSVYPNSGFVAIADVTVEIDSYDALIGVFGIYNNFTIECASGFPEECVVYAQNMLDEMSIDITGFVRIEKKRITVNGYDLQMIGMIPGGEPALAIQVKNKKLLYDAKEDNFEQKSEEETVMCEFQHIIGEQRFKGTVHDIILSSPEVYVDNRARGRSGHMSHALAELSPGRVIDFNSNCSNVRLGGHSAFGFIEYRISEDYGETWGEVQKLPYSVETLMTGIHAVSVEKIVVCNDGSLVAFCLLNDAQKMNCVEPWDTVRVIRSEDGGKSWSDPVELSEYAGRVYDALYREGRIYVLEFCNDASDVFTGTLPEHLYRLYVSEDNGMSFYEESIIPFPSTYGMAYGSMIFNEAGELIVYGYNLYDEVNMSYAISKDYGKTWYETGLSYVAKKIRNPQVAILDGQYILHGRAAACGFVFYTSADGLHWDEGHYHGGEHAPKFGACYYSNNIVLDNPNKPGKKRMLVQYSETYGEPARVDVMHLWIESAD